MLGIHCYVPECINKANGQVTNDHLQAINSCFSRALDTSCVTSSPRHELKSKFYEFVLPDILAVRRLGSSFTFNFCKL